MPNHFYDEREQTELAGKAANFLMEFLEGKHPHSPAVCPIAEFDAVPVRRKRPVRIKLTFWLEKTSPDFRYWNYGFVAKGGKIEVKSTDLTGIFEQLDKIAKPA